MAGLDDVVDVAVRIVVLNQVLFLREAGGFVRIEVSMNVGRAVAF